MRRGSEEREREGRGGGKGGVRPPKIFFGIEPSLTNDSCD